MTQLVRWADRTGTTVRRGNLVGPYRGQEFEETFATEEAAIERERQALAKEPIGPDRPPVAVRCRQIR